MLWKSKSHGKTQGPRRSKVPSKPISQQFVQGAAFTPWDWPPTLCMCSLPFLFSWNQNSPAKMQLATQNSSSTTHRAGFPHASCMCLQRLKNVCNVMQADKMHGSPPQFSEMGKQRQKGRGNGGAPSVTVSNPRQVSAHCTPQFPHQNMTVTILTFDVL